MKRVYPTIVAICICMMVLSPRIAFTQCTCSGGIPATPVTQLIKVDTSTAPTALVTFNKFQDTSTNTPHEMLTCMTIDDTVSIVSSTGVQNTANGPVPNASFTITASATVTGPAVYSLQKGNMDYGPYNFGPAGDSTDTYLLGPDTLVNNKATSITPSNVAPYQGTGTISDTVTFGGGQLSYAGTSFTYTVNTKYWASFKITYYWCPQIVLATSITGFTATQNGNYILLKWTNDNEQNNTNYEIQVSTDGQNFTSLGETESNAAATGASAEYQYQYDLNQANVGKLYFRIKQTDASGKVSYSEVLIITPGGSASEEPISYQIYPNPVTNSLIFRFNSNQTGNYLLELVNTAGQIVEQKSVTLAGTSQIRLDLNPQPAKGLYFMRTRDLTHHQNYVSKVLIN